MVLNSLCKNGLFLAAFSSFVFAICSLIAKQLSEINPVQLCLYSFISIFILASLKLTITGERITPRGCLLLMLARSVCGCAFFILSFYSVQLMPLGDASVLLYTTPLWTMVLALIFIEEPCHTSDLISVGIAMIGVIFVTQPEMIFGKDSSASLANNGSSHQYTLGALSAILASISEAMGNVILRKLKNIDPSIILFNYSLFSIIFCLVIGFSFDCLFSQIDSPILTALLSILTVTEQYLMGYALTLEHAGPVAIVQASDIIYGFIFEVFFYNEETNELSIVGAVIVGLVVIQMAKNKESSHCNNYVSTV